MISEEFPPDNQPKPEKRNLNPSPYLDIGEAADRLKLSPHTLNKWRHQGTGPEFRVHGRRIIYHISDLDSWSLSQKRQKAQQYPGRIPTRSTGDETE